VIGYKEKDVYLQTENLSILLFILKTSGLMKKGLEIASTFLVGAVVGGTVALLFAPDTGERQRRKIKVILERHGIRLAKEEYEKLVDELKSTFNRSKGEGADLDPVQDYDVE